MIEEHYKDVLKWAGSWEVVVGDIGYFCTSRELMHRPFLALPELRRRGQV